MRSCECPELELHREVVHTDQGQQISNYDDGARKGVKSGEGGPFGAVVVRDGEVISHGHNRVLHTNDPTAHAEVVAIREACTKLGTWSLHDCVLYSSCEPCPMCFSAIHWAKIPKCFYSATADDAADVGFDDKFLYDAIKGTADVTKCKIVHAPHHNSSSPFETYSEMLKQGKSQLY